MKKTKISENGVIYCNFNGRITALDCSSLRNEKCFGCFIYDCLNKIKCEHDKDSCNEKK